MILSNLPSRSTSMTVAGNDSTVLTATTNSTRPMNQEHKSRTEARGFAKLLLNVDGLIEALVANYMMDTYETMSECPISFSLSV